MDQLEILRKKFNTSKSDNDRKTVASEIQQYLSLIQKNDIYVEHDYLEYVLEYITPEIPKGKTAAIYCGETGWTKWDPNSTKKGISGSEEAVIYASQVLAKKGYTVTVFGTPPENSVWSISNSNPRFLSHVYYNDWPAPLDLLIIWRNLNFPDWMLAKAKRIYYWLHDMGNPEAPFQIAKQANGVFFLSKYHRDTYPHIDTNYCLSGNGICVEQFDKAVCVNNRRDLYKCIYASNYSRGLSILLSIWPYVKQAVPQATLDIYYGRETYNTVSIDGLKLLINTIESMKELGVTEKGKVGHQELANAMCQASFWTYPCIGGSETFCITAIKAQAAGMIPVTTLVGALDEVVWKESCVTMAEIKTNEHIIEYKDKLIAAMKVISNGVDSFSNMRSKARQHALEFTWDSVVDDWLKLDKEIDED